MFTWMTGCEKHMVEKQQKKTIMFTWVAWRGWLDTIKMAVSSKKEWGGPNPSQPKSKDKQRICLRGWLGAKSMVEKKQPKKR